MAELLHTIENPLLARGIVSGRGVATLKAYADPAYYLMLDLLDRKRGQQLTWAGRTQSMAAWAREPGRTLETLTWRIAYWDLERALSTPRQAQGRPSAQR